MKADTIVGRTRSAALLVLAVATMAVLAVWQPWSTDDSGTAANDATDTTSVPADDTDPGPIVSTEPTGPLKTGAYGLSIDPPPGAVEMQIDLDPSFADARWRPADTNASIDIVDEGYQQVFVRFRDDEGAPAGSQVLGVDVDSTRDAATASDGGGLHRPSWAARAATDVLVVRVESGRIVRSGIEPYDVADPPAGDELERRGVISLITRDGSPYGLTIEGVDTHIRRWDRFVGSPLDGNALEAGPWHVDGPDGTLTPTTVARVSRPIGSMNTPGGDRLSTTINDVYLYFDNALPDGPLDVVGPPEIVEPITFTFSEHESFSPVVHTSAVGHRPDDLRKVATVSVWPGDGPPIDHSGAEFVVVSSDGVEAARGTAEPWHTGAIDELGRGDLTGSSSSLLDFSAITTPGEYRVCVLGIGCGSPVTIDEKRGTLAVTRVARAMYHQRSGIELDPRFTSIERPRGYHPDDGTVVRQADVTLLGADFLSGEVFDELAITPTDAPVVADAWGGHFDAGDWDRRVQHMWYAALAADVSLLFPDAVDELELLIPESGDEIPDILADALWTADFYRRLQLPSGAIRGGIEATGHPVNDSTSWVEPQPAYVYAADPWSSYVYAAGAAHLAEAVEPYDAVLADELTASAVRAAEWAEANPPTFDDNERTENQRPVAAAALFARPGDERWHDVVRESADFGNRVTERLGCDVRIHCDAVWYYLRIDPSRTDPELRDNAMATLISAADLALDNAATTVIGWGIEDDRSRLEWGSGLGGTPKLITLLRAHAITGDERYLVQAQQTAAISTGANPLNTSFITGVGPNPPEHPLVVDSVAGGVPVWPGTPVFGAHTPRGAQTWIIDQLDDAGAHPSVADAPYVWKWFDVNRIAPMNEYTVHQSHGPTLFGLSYLAFFDGP